MVDGMKKFFREASGGPPGAKGSALGSRQGLSPWTPD